LRDYENLVVDDAVNASLTHPYCRSSPAYLPGYPVRTWDKCHHGAWSKVSGTERNDRIERREDYQDCVSLQIACDNVSLRLRDQV